MNVFPVLTQATAQVRTPLSRNRAPASSRFWGCRLGELAQQIVIVVGVLAACFIGPMLAVGFLVLRKRRSRARRRSPIGIELVRSPGHSLREQLDEATNDVSVDVFVLMVMPLLLLAVFLAQGRRGACQPELVDAGPVYP